MICLVFRIANKTHNLNSIMSCATSEPNQFRRIGVVFSGIDNYNQMFPLHEPIEIGDQQRIGIVRARHVYPQSSHGRPITYEKPDKNGCMLLLVELAAGVELPEWECQTIEVERAKGAPIAEKGDVFAFSSTGSNRFICMDVYDRNPDSPCYKVEVFTALMHVSDRNPDEIPAGDVGAVVAGTGTTR